MGRRRDYVWVKWRRRTSASGGKWEWEYFSVPNQYITKSNKILEEGFLKDEFEQRDQEYYWSEHHRGHSWEISKPPKNIIEDELRYKEKKIKYLTLQSNSLKASIK